MFGYGTGWSSWKRYVVLCGLDLVVVVVVVVVMTDDNDSDDDGDSGNDDEDDDDNDDGLTHGRDVNCVMALMLIMVTLVVLIKFFPSAC